MYIVIELQSFDGSVANIVTSYEDRQEAESKYHAILSAAAISSVPVHTAVLMTAKGTVISTQYYEHEPEEVEE